MYLYSKTSGTFKFMLFNIPLIIILFVSMEASSFNNVCYTFDIYPAYMDYANISHILVYISIPTFYYLISSIAIFTLERKLINKKNNITKDNILKIISNEITEIKQFIRNKNNVSSKKTKYKNSKSNFHTSSTYKTIFNSSNNDYNLFQSRKDINYYSINNSFVDSCSNNDTGYDGIKDSFDFPSKDGPIYSPHENQLYDNCFGGWND